MRIRLKEFRQRLGLTLEELVAQSTFSVSQLSRWETGKNNIPSERLPAIAAAYQCRVSEIFADDDEEEEVPIVGAIGAGGSIVFEDVEGGADTMKRPPETRGTLIGLEVRGDSMLPKYDDGDVVFISREWAGVEPQDIGSYCAIRLVSGETYLKKLVRGSEKGRFTLRSLNAEDMENVEVEWATPIRAVVSRAGRRFS